MKIGKHTFGNETFYYVKREEEWGCEYWQSGFWDDFSKIDPSSLKDPTFLHLVKDFFGLTETPLAASADCTVEFYVRSACKDLMECGFFKTPQSFIAVDHRTSAVGVCYRFSRVIYGAKVRHDYSWKPNSNNGMEQ